MALSYKRMVDVIQKPTDQRQTADVKLCESWFRKKSKLLKALNQETLLDLIKHCEFVTRQKDDLIIQQGEKGHRFFIILRGSVCIYIKESLEDVELGEEGESRPISDRSTLGNHIVNLGEGTAFGEIALINPDCIRTASVLADEKTDLVVIHRDLYNRSVSKVVAREYAEKTNFIDHLPIFRGWNPRARKQLAASFKKEVFPFDCTLFKQGDHADNMYFIISGELKLFVDPEAHYQQFEKFMKKCGSVVETDDKSENTSESAYFPQKLLPQLAKFTRVQKASRRQRPSSAGGSDHGHNALSLPASWSPSSIRKMNMEINSRRVNLNLCYLGENQEIGDVEFILGLDVYHATAVCSQETTVFSLQRCHFERLFKKKNPRTIKEMANTLELQLARRVMKPNIVESVPLIKCFVYKLQEEGSRDRRGVAAAGGEDESSFRMPKMKYDTRRQGGGRESRESRAYTWHSGPRSRGSTSSGSGSGSDNSTGVYARNGLGQRSKTMAVS